ncbi:hypothetical protein PQU92_15755 [Asticcacaulis sp. BYS171W]|uniref:Lipoprotein n=1 Tax=Asticcacaulis aquaticus TaxID=2984212 RepID=A0ABT5HY15_9CAUL|nr:hypothetical protein [Asticcacaulis aquaticus]MDC7684740.1 hypothetical protein [Asticcacaulis aquaticus]
MRKSAFSVCMLGLALLSGCSSYIQGGDLIRPNEPTGTLRLSNDTGAPIGVVLVSNCNHSTYGLNRLPKGYEIPTGGHYDFKVSAGCWDVSAGRVLGHNSWSEGRKRVTVNANSVTNLTSQTMSEKRN